MSRLEQLNERLFGTVPRESERSWPDWASFLFNGRLHTFSLSQSAVHAKQEDIGPEFQSLASLAYLSNAVVFAVCGVRMRLFSEARFQFRQIRSGTPGDLFGTPALAPLENPWPGGTTGDLLARAEQDATLAGNNFTIRQGDSLERLRPDWVTIIAGSPKQDATVWDVGSRVLGYGYQPGGPGGNQDPVFFDVSEVAHFAPIPDPLSRFRGVSWLTSILREIMADSAARDYKLSFFEEGGTPNMVLKADETVDSERFKQFAAAYRAERPTHAKETLFLASGVEASVVGSDFEQMDFKNVVGAGETRIAAVGGIAPVVVGLSEGLAAATYSNYGQARRSVADVWMRPSLRNVCGAFANIIDVPGGSELWYDDRDISFMQEDMKDAAEIQQVQAGAIRQLVDAGFKPDTVVDAINAGDFARLVHTDLFSVQLQPPGTVPTNGAGNPDAIQELANALRERAEGDTE